MAGVTQQIPHYLGGISEQPDQLKKPGQVKDALNVIPDPVWGLYKRPGAKRISPDGNKLANVSNDDHATWFSYYRDPTEGSYVGQVDQSGVLKVWDCKTGSSKFIKYGDGGETAIKAYLSEGRGNDTGSKHDLQFLTLMDTTFVVNRNQKVGMDAADKTQGYPTWDDSGTTKEETYFAFIDLLRTENGRQYSLNVYDTDAIYTYQTARTIEFAGEGDESTGVNHSNGADDPNTGTLTRNDTLFDGDGSGTCRGVGTQVFTYNGHGGQNKTPRNHKQHNLIFRITTTGQSGLKVDAEPGNNGFVSNDYKCTYNRELTLLHGGEGWHHKDTTQPLNWVDTNGNALHATGSTTQANIESYHGNDPSSHTPGNGENIVVMTDQPHGAHDGKQVQYRIRVKDSEIIKTKGYVNNKPVGVIRPHPTPWDADMAVTSDVILNGIMRQMEHNRAFHETDSNLNSVTSGAGYGLLDPANGIHAKVIGNGLYLWSNTKKFNVETTDTDLMRVMQDTVNDVSKLPTQCRHGYIVKISNSQKVEEDDYYLRFVGQNNKDGPGAWEECAKPGLVKKFSTHTMPHVIQRKQDDSSGTITGSANAIYFEVGQWKWGEREVGDEVTNPIPSFMGSNPTLYTDSNSRNFNDVQTYAESAKVTINKVLFFRNRLALLSEENVILSRPGTFNKPNFWSTSALTISKTDPIDIACAGTFPSVLYDGIETNVGLLLFSRNQQFLLCADAEALNNDTAKLKSISTYYYNEKIPPISLGTTHGFTDNSGKYGRFQEMLNVQREGAATVIETSKLVPSLLDNNLNLLTNSRENGMVFLGKCKYRVGGTQYAGNDEIVVYKYADSISSQAATGTERTQHSWFKWKFQNPLRYHFCSDDSYYFVDEDDFLQQIYLVDSTSDYMVDAYFTQDNNKYLVHMDNWWPHGSENASYNGGADETTYTLPYLSDITHTHGTDPKFVGICLDAVIQADADVDVGSRNSKGLYVEAKSVSGTSAVFPGDWTPGGENLDSGKKLHFGFLYDYKVDIPRIYLGKAVSATSYRNDVNGRLTIHRLHLNFGRVGVYDTTLTRAGKNAYTDNHESLYANEYNVGDLPWLEEDTRTIPVYEKNDNVEISLKSAHPSHATLHSMSWEGDYSPKSYKRV